MITIYVLINIIFVLCSREFFESLQDICTPSDIKDALNFNIVVKPLQTQPGCKDQNFHQDFDVIIVNFSQYKFSSKLSSLS